MKRIYEEVREPGGKEFRVPIGISNRHVHLDRADMDALFGPGSELTPIKDLGQPGQYACDEVVTLKGPKGELKKVRVLGPLRKETQIEISITDGFALGIKGVPVRESGKLDGTPGIEIIGPKGTVVKNQGVIVALRHIHMLPSDAEKLGLKDKEIVSVVFGDATRGSIMDEVLMRVTDTSGLEIHIDMEEANTVGAKNGDTVAILRCAVNE